MLKTALALASAIAILLLAFSALPVAAVPPAQQTGQIRWAYYVPEDSASLTSLRQRQGELDYVGLHWATMRADGTVELKAKQDVISTVRSIGAKPILSVTAGSDDAAHSYLATDASRAAVVENLLATMPDYDGISIDFEGLLAEDRTPLTQFMSRLATRFRPAGKLVTIAISAKSSDTRTGWAGFFDYAGLAPNADLFILMTYGFRTANSSVPGSSAPISWMNSCLNYAVSQIPAGKLLLGIPFYGYDWDTTSGPPAKAMRYSDAMAIAGQMGLAVDHDQTQQAARLSYSKDGHNHEVWFEDRASIDAKLALMSQRGLAGWAGWRLGHEDSQAWQSLSRRATSPTAIPQPTSTSVPQAPLPTAVPVQPTAVPIPPTATPAPSAGSNNRWYFAEGSTQPPFDTWILLMNPYPIPATATVTFMKDDGASLVQRFGIAPNSRFSIYANQLLPDAAFSTLIESDRPVFAERSMYFRTDGHGSPAVAAPSRSWYLAEGSTQSPFDSWILVMNPNPRPNKVTFTLMADSGENRVFVHEIPANSRYSLLVNLVMPNAAFSTKVEGDSPIIVERSMYFAGGGHGTTGVTSPSRNWYMAEGDTSFGFDSWLLLSNPNNVMANTTVTYARPDGSRITQSYGIAPRSRFSVYVNDVLPDTQLSMKVEADQPVIAERAMYFGDRGGHVTVAASSLSRVWYLPEGSTASPFTEYVLIANPNGAPAEITITWMQEGGRNSSQYLTIPAYGRATINANDVIPNAALSARVDASVPVVVERSMYFSKGDGGTNTIGIPAGQ